MTKHFSPIPLPTYQTERQKTRNDFEVLLIVQTRKDNPLCALQKYHLVSVVAQGQHSYTHETTGSTTVT